MSDQEKMHPPKRKTKPITSYFTKIPRSGQTSYEDEDAPSGIKVAGEVKWPEMLISDQTETVF